MSEQLVSPVLGRLTASFQRAWNDCQAIKNPVNDWAQGLFEAERVGFEPTVGLHPRWFSRPSWDSVMAMFLGRSVTDGDTFSTHWLALVPKANHLSIEALDFLSQGVQDRVKKSGTV